MRHVLWVNGCPSLGGGEIAQIAIFREIAKALDVSAVVPDDAWATLKGSMASAASGVNGSGPSSASSVLCGQANLPGRPASSPHARVFSCV